MTDRTDFNESWVWESPQRLPIADYYGSLVTIIQDYSERYEVINLGTYKNFDVRKIVLETIVFYWFELDGLILLVVELAINSQGLKVSLLGKIPSLKGKPPYASDLYSFILNDTKRGIRIYSDEAMSDEGVDVWKRLYMDGHTISVYNNKNPGGSFITLFGFFDFDNFFGDDRDYKKYQFVLNESHFLADTRNFFHLRRIRELSGNFVDD